ncbi:hypothetical protein FS749_012060 [Ceratobasidium sp. UAMH 11750]|nr:hypothetical protein FS749_012060 [Ceratobasidium sp. UAMH 11750]
MPVSPSAPHYVCVPSPLSHPGPPARSRLASRIPGSARPCTRSIARCPMRASMLASPPSRPCTYHGRVALVLAPPSLALAHSVTLPFFAHASPPNRYIPRPNPPAPPLTVLVTLSALAPAHPLALPRLHCTHSYPRTLVRPRWLSHVRSCPLAAVPGPRMLSRLHRSLAASPALNLGVPRLVALALSVARRPHLYEHVPRL